MGITERLARFAIETPGEAIPSAVFDSAKLKYLDTLGVMVAGSRHPASAISPAFGPITWAPSPWHMPSTWTSRPAGIKGAARRWSTTVVPSHRGP